MEEIANGKSQNQQIGKSQIANAIKGFSPQRRKERKDFLILSLRPSRLRGSKDSRD